MTAPPATATTQRGVRGAHATPLRQVVRIAPIFPVKKQGNMLLQQGLLLLQMPQGGVAQGSAIHPGVSVVQQSHKQRGEVFLRVHSGNEAGQGEGEGSFTGDFCLGKGVEGRGCGKALGRSGDGG